MRNLLNTVKVDAPNSNTFDLTHDVKLSLKMGTLIPIMCLEAIPGDFFRIACQLLLRFMPMIAPVMHRMDAYIHYFFVPNRLVWDHWETFITGAYGTTPPAAPYFTLNPGDAPPGSLLNYFGIPNNTINTPSINAMPIAGYIKIYNDYYRDENLIAERPYKLKDGNNDAEPINSWAGVIQKRAWEHDYFTSCLPFAQKGAPVEIPISGVVGGTDLRVKFQDSTSTYTAGVWTLQGVPAGSPPAGVVAGMSDIPGITDGALYADVVGGGSVTGGTMNDLRTAMRLQEWLEKNARGGTRYTEFLKMHFNVKSSDARLQRPEYITGSKVPVIISEVLNTTGETGGLPQGNMAGHGIAANSGKQGGFYCEEHGFIIGILSVIPRTSYYQGLHKMWQRWEPTDYAFPSFAHLGEQAVQNNELFVDHTNPEEPFGYLPRYTEYKVMPSKTVGDLQTTLDFWHLARKFQTGVDEPDLNEFFISCDPRSDIFAVDDGTDYLVGHVLNEVHVNRKLPMFGQPTF